MEGSGINCPANLVIGFSSILWRKLTTNLFFQVPPCLGHFRTNTKTLDLLRVITKMGEDKPVNAARNEGDEYLSMKKGPNDLRTVRELKDALSWKKQRDDQALRATRIEEAKHEIQVTKNFMYIVRVYIFIVVLSYYASNWRHYVSNWTKEVLLTEEQRDSLAFPDYTLAHNRPFPYVYSNNALSLNQNNNETGTGKEKKVSKGDVTELQLVAAGMRKVCRVQCVCDRAIHVTRFDSIVEHTEILNTH